MGAVIGAAVGGLAGAQGQTTTQTSNPNLAAQTALQQQTTAGVSSDYSTLENDVNAGPGQQDISNYESNSQSLAQMLGQYAQNGGMPSSSDFTQANGLASQAFAGQQTALNQSFQTQSQNAAAQDAMMGRSATDPTLQGSLAQSQMLQQQQLSANQGSYGTQLAMALPQQRLGYATQQNQLLGGLATQALNNRSSLLSMGNSIMSGQQNYQLGMSGNTTTQHSGGGFGGFLTGAMGGAGAGMSVASMGAVNGQNTGMSTQGGYQQASQPNFGASSYGESGISTGGTGSPFSLFGSGSGSSNMFSGAAAAGG